MIIIDTEKRVDWNAIRAEYIAGDTSYRILAEKYDLSKDAIARKAKAQGWDKDRATVRDKAAKKVIQKTASVVADNATIAANIKRKALIILEGLLDEYVGLRSTEHRENKQGVTDVIRFRDLTAAYKDLTEDLPKADGDKNAPVYELLKRLDGECDV